MEMQIARLALTPRMTLTRTTIKQRHPLLASLLHTALGAAAMVVLTLCAPTGALAGQPGFLAAQAKIVDSGQMQLAGALNYRIRDETALPLMDGRLNIGFGGWHELGLLLHFDTDGDRQDGLTRPGIAWTGLLMRSTPEGRPGIAIESYMTMPVGLGRARDQTIYGLAHVRFTQEAARGRLQFHGNGGVRAWLPHKGSLQARLWWAGRAEAGAAHNGWRFFVEAGAGNPRQVQGEYLAFQTGLRALFADVIGLHFLLGVRPELTTNTDRQWWLTGGLHMTFDALRPEGSLGHERGGAGLFTPDPEPFGDR